MNTQLYQVTLTDLGTYEVTVAADSPKRRRWDRQGCALRGSDPAAAWNAHRQA